ncbi:MAG: RluA family pseudouridine synthase [Ruminococcaceae bacterium]|nr:RluA family pseudouridine synthase [Oscillospiraceae bacterium]
MRKIEINKNDSGQRVDKFLTKYFKHLPQSMIYKWLRKKKIRLNGKHPKNEEFLNEGDVFEIYVNDEFFPEDKKLPDWIYLAQDINIVYEDENILVCDKPSGVLAHDGKNSLINMIMAYLYRKGEYNPLNENTFSPALCHRIDRNTSGLVIAAKNAKALRFINEKIRLREIRKFYFLKIDCPPPQKSGEIRGYIKKDFATNKVTFSDKEIEGGQLAVTRYKVVDGGVEAELLTGRTHQIRASFSHIGCPISGDVKYGARKNGKTDFQELRARKLIFDFKDCNDFEYLKGKIIEIK